jgi:hypothetical protein
MVVGEVVSMVERVGAACGGPDELAIAEAALVDLRRIQSWCDASHVTLTAVVARCTPVPERSLSNAGRISEREAEKLVRRTKLANDLPELGAALAGGEVSGGHLDVVARARAGLEPEERKRFDAAAGRLANCASRSTVEDFTRQVSAEARRARAGDGTDRLEQQQRASRCRTWVDRVTGMWCMRLEVDPATGVHLDGQLRAALESLFAESTPPTAPSDPKEKQDHLRALAVTALLMGEGAASAGATGEDAASEDAASEGAAGEGAGSRAGAGRPAVVVVVDTRCSTHQCEPAAAPAPTGEPTTLAAGSDEATPPDARFASGEPTAPDARYCGGEPTVDWGLPVELPATVLLSLYPEARVHPVIVRGGVVLHAPGRLDLGRTTRLANAAQRRVLRALYPRCALPGCDVRFDHCKIHHVVWWRHGGRTDLANLLPVCVKHHVKIHDHGWHVELGADRTMTVTLPDGTRQTTGPPRRAAA